MDKIKKIWKEHKFEICLGGCAVACGVAAYFITKNKFVVNLAKENCIHWKPSDSYMNLERVKEILELNKDNLAQFAVFREGPDPDKYTVIVLNDMKDFVAH